MHREVPDAICKRTPKLLSGAAAKLAALACQSAEWTKLPEESVPVAVFLVGAQRSFHCGTQESSAMCGSPATI